MSIEWTERPYLRDPIAIIAYEGWGDASDAASGAVEYLIEQADVEPFARIDGEEFMNYQMSRPVVEFDDDGNRIIHWPATGAFALTLSGHHRDVVVMLGEEPHTRWRLYTSTMLGFLRELGVSQVITLGAFIGQVPHTLPVPIFGSASDPELVAGHNLFASNYEGPTGIVGVLNDAFQTGGFDTVTLWAAIPHYLAANPNPKAMMTLLQKAGAVMAYDFDLSDLQVDVLEFDENVEEAMADNDEFVDYVRTLEEEVDVPNAMPGDGAQLLEEIEQYLRGSEGPS